MSSADIPDDPTDHRTDPGETRFERFVDTAIEVERETGRREATEEQAKRRLLTRVAIIVAGTFVALLGLALLALPGPGLLVVALGLGIMASEVPFAERLLDRVKARLPQDGDGKIPRRTIVLMVVVAVGAVALSTAFSIWWATRP